MLRIHAILIIVFSMVSVGYSQDTTIPKIENPTIKKNYDEPTGVVNGTIANSLKNDETNDNKCSFILKFKDLTEDEVKEIDQKELKKLIEITLLEYKLKKFRKEEGLDHNNIDRYKYDHGNHIVSPATYPYLASKDSKEIDAIKYLSEKIWYLEEKIKNQERLITHYKNLVDELKNELSNIKGKEN